MTTARRQQICLGITPFYHCVTRCVRRAYLCGYDRVGKRNLNHHWQWIEDRLVLLAEVFCIDIAGFAVMSNHYHVVLHVDQEKANALSDDEVQDRWLRLYCGTDAVQRYRAGEELSATELNLVATTVALYRDHLSNLSRFMGNLNEYVARRANREDDCKGAVWESRFRSQSILDDEALVNVLCYVDLNPVRARVAKTPEASTHTSVHRRLKKRKTGLMPFSPSRTTSASASNQSAQCPPVTLKRYLEVLDWTGRLIKAGKRGAINESAPSIITRLGHTLTTWLKTQTPQLSWKQKALGSADRIKEYCEAIDQRWIWQGN